MEIVNLTWENILLNKKEKDSIQKEFYSKMRKTYDFDRELRERLLHIIRKGKSITGFPKHQFCNWEVANHRVSYGEDLIKVPIYNVSEHKSEYYRTLKIPTRWLSMPDDEWMLELSDRFNSKKIALQKEIDEESKKEEDLIKSILSCSNEFKKELKKLL